MAINYDVLVVGAEPAGSSVRLFCKYDQIESQIRSVIYANPPDKAYIAD